MLSARTPFCGEAKPVSWLFFFAAEDERMAAKGCEEARASAKRRNLDVGRAFVTNPAAEGEGAPNESVLASRCPEREEHIRRLSDSWRPGARKIAERFGVDPGTVQRISRPRPFADVAAGLPRPIGEGADRVRRPFCSQRQSLNEFGIRELRQIRDLLDDADLE